MQAFIKERDSLKVFLTRAERAGTGKDLHGQAKGDAMESDIANELVEIQQQFDDYRAEVNSVRPREEAVSAQREVAQLTAQLAKATAKLEVAGGMSLCRLWFWAMFLPSTTYIASICHRNSGCSPYGIWMT